MARLLPELTDRVQTVLDGGPTRRGIESTIVALRDDGSWQVLRPGPIGEEEIAAAIGPSAIYVKSGMIEA